MCLNASCARQLADESAHALAVLHLEPSFANASNNKFHLKGSHEISEGSPEVAERSSPETQQKLQFHASAYTHQELEVLACAESSLMCAFPPPMCCVFLT